MPEVAVQFLLAIVGWVWLASGASKLANPQSLADVLHRWFPRSATVARTARGATVLLGVVETLVGLSIVVPVERLVDIGVAASFALLVIFVAVSSVAMAGGYRGDCGCGGIAGGSRIGWLHLLLTSAMGTISALSLFGPVRMHTDAPAVLMSLTGLAAILAYKTILELRHIGMRLAPHSSGARPGEMA